MKTGVFLLALDLQSTGLIVHLLMSMLFLASMEFVAIRQPVLWFAHLVTLQLDNVVQNVERTDELVSGTGRENLDIAELVLLKNQSPTIH